MKVGSKEINNTALEVSETFLLLAIRLPVKISQPGHDGRAAVRPTGVTFNNASRHNCSLNLLGNVCSLTLSPCVFSPDGTEIIKVVKTRPSPPP